MTKTQIIERINQLNRELSDNKNMCSQYQNLKNKLTQIISLLNNSIKTLNDSLNYLKSGYGNNIKTTPYKTTNKDMEIVMDLKKFLNSNVTPTINNHINYLNGRISELQDEINYLWGEYNRATD